MSVQFTPLVIPYALSALLTIGLAVYGLKRGRADEFDKTTITFIAIVGFATVWTVARIAALTVTDEALTRFFLTIIYIGWPGSAMSVLLFAFAYTGREELVTPRNSALLLAPALTVVLFAMTNESHHLLYTGEFVEQNGILIYKREFQPLFFAYMLYINGATIYGVYLLLRMTLSSPRLYRQQTTAFAIGSITPLVLGTMFALNVTPFVPGFVDLTPVGFAVLGLCYGYAVFKCQLLELVPVARDVVIESMHDGYIVLDTEDRIVDYNDAAREILAESAGIIGEPIGEKIPQMAPLIDGHDPDSHEEIEITATIDGTQRFLVATLTGLHTEERLIGRLLLLRDVTDRRAIQKRYQALIENASDLILVLDPDGTVTYASPSITNILGRPPGTIRGKNGFDLVHDDDRETLQSMFADLLETAEETRRCTYRTKRADGEWRVMEGVGRNLLADPFVEGIVVNARDITERKRRERELERANDQLEEFASVVSHDLRNPLNVADGHLQIAKETAEEPSLDEVQISLDRMEAIIDDVLTLARNGQSIGETEPIELEGVAREAWENVATDEATLVVTTSATFDGDRGRVLQLFENLFRNAHEHVAPSVTVTVEGGDGTVAVEDDGPGIPADQREAVLESGYTTNENGTGFGLSIVSQIADAHGWSIAVESGTKGGARFVISGVQTRAADDLNTAIEDDRH